MSDGLHDVLMILKGNGTEVEAREIKAVRSSTLPKHRTWDVVLSVLPVTILKMEQLLWRDAIFSTWRGLGFQAANWTLDRLQINPNTYGILP